MPETQTILSIMLILRSTLSRAQNHAIYSRQGIHVPTRIQNQNAELFPYYKVYLQ